MAYCAFNMLFTRSVPHIHEKIFLSMDYESFKNCLEVSKSWNNLLISEHFQLMGKPVFCLQLQKELWNNGCTAIHKAAISGQTHVA